MNSVAEPQEGMSSQAAMPAGMRCEKFGTGPFSTGTAGSSQESQATRDVDFVGHSGEGVIGYRACFALQNHDETPKSFSGNALRFLLRSFAVYTPEMYIEGSSVEDGQVMSGCDE